MHCDVRVEDVQPQLHRPAIPRQVLDFNERLGLDILSLPRWEGFSKSVKCLSIVSHGTLFQMIIPRDPKEVILDPAGENLHDIFLDPLELNSDPGKLESQKQTVEHPRWFSRKCWTQRSRKTRESMESA